MVTCSSLRLHVSESKKWFRRLWWANQSPFVPVTPLDTADPPITLPLTDTTRSFHSLPHKRQEMKDKHERVKKEGIIR
jgi:hypothetical protein